MAAGRTTLLGRIRGLVVLWSSRSAERRALAALDGHGLKDVGISRGQQVREARKWFWQR